MAETGAPRLVHVVEDDDSMRSSLERLLGGAGYAVRLYESAEALLEVAGPALGGCLLVDLRLPGASGLELQDRLLAAQCPAPVVFLTGHGDLTAGIRAIKRGAVDFLLKPIDADALFEAVETALGRGDEARRVQAERLDLQGRAATLTGRQREVWLRVVRGQLNKEIAHDMGLVERTVKLHRAKAMARLGARTTADLVRIAERLGLGRAGG